MSTLPEYKKPTDITTLRENIHRFAQYPALLQRTVLEHLSEITEHGVQIVDATNPVAFTIEAAAVLASEAISTDMVLNRKQYPFAAQTEDDLYLHMCDVDYIGRFALPSRARIDFLLELDEVTERMVWDANLGVRKLIIPRNTQVSVGGIYFTFEYPIIIQQYTHGGIQVMYDGEILSPLQDIRSNIIDWQIMDMREMQWLAFSVTLLQTQAQSHIVNVTPAAPVKANFAYEDYFYHCRVFYKNNSDAWVEMDTTHTPELYDIRKPTAVLKVTEGNLNVFVPQFYTNTGMVDRAIRVDIYTTRGDLQMNLNGYGPEEYQTEFIAFDKARDDGEFSAPLRAFNNFKTYSQDRTTGGRAPLSFAELRERVITNSTGPKNIPISNVQIAKVLEDEGFRNVRNVDLVTNRSYLASRALPAPSNAKLITAASASIETLFATVKGMMVSAAVIDNATSVTLTPDVIYESRNGQLQIVPTYQINSLMAMPPEQRAVEINRHHYLYTPFHYVIDMDDNELDLRAYYLDNPQVASKTYIESNPTTLLEVGIETYDIKRSPRGYTLQIITKSSDAFKALRNDEIAVQILYRPTGERDYAYLNGRFIGVSPSNERIYEFPLNTNFDLNNNHDLILTNFKMYDDENRKIPVRLLQDFQVIFMTRSDMPNTYVRNRMDDRLGHWLLPNNVKAIVAENIRIEFGKVLKSLWKQSRTVASTEDYERYVADIPRTYTEDVYDNVRVENDEVVYDIIHRKGDLVKDAKGNTVMKHRKGELVLGNNGKPIVKNKRELVRQLDLMLIEAPYYFATDSIAAQYRQEIVDTFLDWMIDGLDTINERTLEQTVVYFYPQATLGQVNIMYNNSIRTKIDAPQSLVVDLVVNRNTYNNLDLRKSISTTTIQVVSELLTNATISNSMILSSLVEIYGNDVLGVKLVGLGSDTEITAMTVLDDTKRCCLKKRLYVQPDNSMIVEEDISINFVLMDKQELIW